MKELLALLLALVMIFALAACGAGDTANKDDDDKKPTEKKGLEDSWTWTITMDGEAMGMEGFDGGFTVAVVIDFTKDGKFTMTLDEKVMEKSIEDFADAMVDYLVDQGAGSKDEVQAIVDEMDVASMFDEVREDMEASGTYKTEGDKLTMVKDGEEAVYTYKLDGDDLTLTPEDEEELEALEMFGVETMDLKRN